jgi:hypothetical protein
MMLSSTLLRNSFSLVIPAEAGIQARWHSRIVVYFKKASIHVAWIPAFAGMTDLKLLNAYR